jgi:hypothetical protein
LGFVTDKRTKGQVAIIVLSEKYNQNSVFAIEMCGLVPHNIIPEE